MSIGYLLHAHKGHKYYASMLVEGEGLTVFSSLFNDCAFCVVIAEIATAAAEQHCGCFSIHVGQVPSAIIITLRFRGWWGAHSAAWAMLSGRLLVVVKNKLLWV